MGVAAMKLMDGFSPKYQDSYRRSYGAYERRIPSAELERMRNAHATGGMSGILKSPEFQKNQEKLATPKTYAPPTSYGKTTVN
jgi:hypothetical protein